MLAKSGPMSMAKGGKKKTMSKKSMGGKKKYGMGKGK